MGAPLLTLTAPSGDWIYDGVCRRDPDYMDGTTPDEVEDAKRVCKACPVIRKCRDWVLSLPDSRDVYGVCAAMTAEERTKARRRIRRTLPPAVEPTKECRRCLVVKPVNRFYQRPARKDGRDSYCRPCCAELARERAADKNANEQIKDVKGIAS